jgi:hypothetical protein
VAEREHVAVYIDFDNVVLSRYDELNGERSFHNDGAGNPQPPEAIAKKLETARIDVAAILEYAASFGTVAISRAYADWSWPVHTAYRRDMVQASIDLVQMFPLSGSKNGADIRLAIDVIDDLARYDYISHVVIVAGDSDYVSLAQRCKRLGRTVVGVGVDGSVGRYWQSSCDVFKMYGALPGVKQAQPVAAAPRKKSASARKTAVAEPKSTQLLRRAMSLQGERSTDGWVTASAVKNQMLRLDATFDEKSEGYKSFTAFLAAQSAIVETQTSNKTLSVRLLGG